MKGTTYGTTTDFDGYFKLNVDDYLGNNDTMMMIVVNYIGYSTKELPILKSDYEGIEKVKLDIVLEASEMMFTTTFSVRKLKWYEKIGRGFRNIFRRKN